MVPIERPTKSDIDAELKFVGSGEEIPERIMKLEPSLVADRLRKPTFQKPALQSNWQA